MNTANREIKFRAWAVASKEMFYPNTDDGFDIVSGVINPLPNTILMQFTGLKDKNNIDIYEGDLLRVNHDAPIHKLIWSSYYNGWRLQLDNGSEFEVNTILFQVIGNIYQHHNLFQIN